MANCVLGYQESHLKARRSHFLPLYFCRSLKFCLCKTRRIPKVKSRDLLLGHHRTAWAA